MLDIGNQLYRRTQMAKNALFLQGELAQLTYLSYEETVKRITDDPKEEIELSYPVGYRPDKSVIPGQKIYKKDELIERYIYLGENQLPINFIYQLVTILETTLGDLLRLVLKKYPSKIGSKRTIKSSVVLSANSIEEIHEQTVNSVLNEMAYKSPKDYSEDFNSLTSVNLMECPSYHRYIETKATRDIYIHNNGYANDIYTAKAGTHSRVKSGEYLPLNNMYFLESFEATLQIIEWLQKALNEIWHSSEYDDFVQKRVNAQQNA